MIARVHSSILQGIDAIAGEVEADVARGGMGELKLVGMAETAVKESVSRIQAALRNSPDASGRAGPAEQEAGLRRPACRGSISRVWPG